jgi:putative hydrolase of the HAD superfamily
MKAFAHIDTWIFDLDNTLYPASCRLFDQMHVRMSEFLMQLFAVDHAEAKRIQKELYYKHGTTLRGLIVEHGQNPDGFLDYVHDIDYSPVETDLTLIRALERLPGRRLVFTNGTTAHAERVMERLGVAEAFHGIFDIVDSEHIPKPQRDPYERFLRHYAIEPTRAAMFEDIARNLEVPHALGMTTVLVTSVENPDANRINDGEIGPHVHHQTSHLPGFLTELTPLPRDGTGQR